MRLNIFAYHPEDIFSDAFCNTIRFELCKFFSGQRWNQFLKFFFYLHVINLKKPQGFSRPDASSLWLKIIFYFTGQHKYTNVKFFTPFTFEQRTNKPHKQ